MQHVVIPHYVVSATPYHRVLREQLYNVVRAYRAGRIDRAAASRRIGRAIRLDRQHKRNALR